MGHAGITTAKLVNFTRIIVLLAFAACNVLNAQEAVRASMAGERAAEARKRARTDTYYNLDLDPVKLRFSATMGAEYNDNVVLRAAQPEEDFILRPQLGIRAFWPISQRNALDIRLDLGYEHYFNGARQSRFIVSGDQNSGINFDVYISDFAINLHDEFSLSQDTSANPTANAGLADIFRLENTLGTTVMWDLYKVLLEFNYDHYNYLPLDNIYEYLKHASELGSVRATALLNPAVSAGIELGGGLTTYDNELLSDNEHLSFGPFARYKPSEAMTIRASVGYVIYWFDASSFITNATEQTGFYADLSIEHTATKRTRQTLNLGQSLTTDLNGTPVQLFYFRYGLSLSIIRHWTFRPYFSFETGSETRGRIQEELTRYGAGITASRRITQKLSGSLSYQYLTKQSDVPNFDYTQNRLVLNLIYQF